MLSTPNAIPQAVSDTQLAPYNTRPAYNPATYNSPRQPTGSAQIAPCQTYQFGPLHRGYQRTDNKKIYQIDGNLVEDQPEDFHTIFDDENEDVNYSDKDFKEVAVNFVGIKTSCNKCRAIFPSWSKLHHYLRGDWWEVTFLSLSTEAIFPIPIIVYKAVYQVFSLDLYSGAWHMPPRLLFSPPSIYRQTLTANWQPALILDVESPWSIKAGFQSTFWHKRFLQCSLL